MATIHVIPAERRVMGSEQRRSTQPRTTDRRSGDERRQPEYACVPKDQLDTFLEFLAARYERLSAFIQDKEKKKLIIVGASFTVLSLVTSVLMGIVSLEPNGFEVLLRTPFTILFVVVIIGIVFANASIIKYVVSMKCQSLLATRQANCMRQAMHNVLYAKLEGVFPRTLNEQMLKDKDTKDSLLDETTRYWMLYGRHEKFPLNNAELRGNYKSSSIYYKSSDIFAISAIAAYTLMLAISPIIFLMLKTDELQFNASIAMLLGVICGMSAILLILFVITALRSSMHGIRATLSRDEWINFQDNKPPSFRSGPSI